MCSLGGRGVWEGRELSPCFRFVIFVCTFVCHWVFFFTMGENGGGSGMTRLEGLYGLLENGTSPSVRRMAAVQIGELVAAYPTKARSVLNRVRRLLLVADWDTRVAAGYAVKAISDQTPSYVVQTEENENVRTCNQNTLI